METDLKSAKAKDKCLLFCKLLCGELKAVFLVYF